MDTNFSSNECRQQGLFQLTKQATRSLSPSMLRPNPTTNEAVSFLIHSGLLRHFSWTREDEIRLGAPQGSPSHQAMMASMAAVGMAMLSSVRKSSTMKVTAAREFGSALTLVNTALSDKVQAKSHFTLAAVLLLSIFEIVTSRRQEDLDAWTNHAYGAAALLELREADQFQDELGLGLFYQTRFQIIVCCLQTISYFPPSVTKLLKSATFLPSGISPYSENIMDINTKLTNLRADIKRAKITSDAEILSAAYEIDAELTMWLASLPLNFAFITACADSRLENHCCGVSAYSNWYHIYPDLWICSIWNHYRCARILVGEIIASELKRLRKRTPAVSLSKDFQIQEQSIYDRVRECATDICYSIPYYFGAADIGKAEGPSGYSSVHSISGRYAGSLVVLWFLTMAGTTDEVGSPLRNYAIDVLRIIGNEFGIGQALMLVGSLDNGSFYFGYERDDDDSDISGQDFNRGILMNGS